MAAAASESYGDSDNEITVPTQQQSQQQQQQRRKKFTPKPGATTYGYVAVHGQRFKNELCRDFAHGHCSRKHCKYLHQVLVGVFMCLCMKHCDCEGFL